MCIVIDINTIGCVFGVDEGCRDDFKPVRDWITSRKCKSKWILGGTTYWEELSNMKNYIKVYGELKRSGKIIYLEDSEVDEQENKLKEIKTDADFDDSHIIAIIIVSGCKLLCSNDKRSDKYVTNRDLYPKKQKPPSIYRYKDHERLLNDGNIVPRCKKSRQTK